MTIGTATLVGVDARAVRVECDVVAGLPGVRFVGLPDAAVREAADRVQSAIRKSGYQWPDRRIVVNLAPAGLRKTGAGFDLPVALAVLGATEQLPGASLADTWAFGELGLEGETRPVRGALPVARAAWRRGRRLLVPDRMAVEAGLLEDVEVVPIADLREAVEVLAGQRGPRPAPDPVPAPAAPPPDLAEVRGQHVARRSLELAAAGGHHLLLVGPPGCGKTMLAKRLPGILPALDVDAALEVAAVHSIAGVREPDDPLSLRPPLREPHHTVSRAGLIGGGTGLARPGELSLAHHGVLLMDEVLEVPRWILDALRQPLERGEVVVVRSLGAVRYPARVLLVAAANPCPCGNLGGSRRACRCRPDQIERYRARLSGPLLDRIDLQVEVTPVERERLAGPADGEPTSVVAARVDAARSAAAQRWRPGVLNRDASIEAIRATCARGVVSSLARAVEALGLSARAFDRSLRVARTIADLDGREHVTKDDVEEAIAYRLADLASVA